MSRAIVIFARLPEIEAASKRLPMAKAAPLFRTLAAHWLRAAHEAGATAIIACVRTEVKQFQRVAPGVSRCYVEQRGATFGNRLAAAAADAFAGGHESVLIAGIDAPPPHDLRRVFEQLQQTQAVVAAARDGGINFIALRAPEQALLSSLRPGQRDVLYRCRAHFQSLIVLPPSTDIDSFDDIRRACGEESWRDYRTLLDAFTEAPRRWTIGALVQRPAIASAPRAPPA